jgi:endonuclease YncB( thermonuclease family)
MIALLIGAPLAMWAGGSSAFGKTRPESEHIALKQGETGSVSYVIDGDGFVLQSGLKVKLAGIEAPQRAWPEQNRIAFPLSEEARDALEQLVKNKSVGLYYGGETRDRYDRALAQVWLLDKNGEKQLWLQEAMVKAGYARVYSWPGQTIRPTLRSELARSTQKHSSKPALIRSASKARACGYGDGLSCKTGP